MNLVKKTVPLKAEFIVTVNIFKEATPGIPQQGHVKGTGEGTPFGKAAPKPQLITGKLKLLVN